MQHELMVATPNLHVLAAAAEDLVIKDEQVEGVLLGTNIDGGEVDDGCR